MQDLIGLLLIFTPFALLIYFSIRRTNKKFKKEEAELAMLSPQKQILERKKKEKEAVAGIGLFFFLIGSQVAGYIDMSMAIAIGIILLVVLFVFFKIRNRN